MALIITLILLGVVTFMAIAFLALSKRERGSVATVTDTAGARLAADAALANAEAQIIANAFSTTNPFNFGLLVSTNYINPVGFQANSSSYTNVNYYDTFGNFLTGDNFLQNLTNLWYSPRPPVFVPIPGTAANDFRYYLDLNRNGRDDPNGLQPVLSPDPARPYYDDNGNTIPNIIFGNTMSNTVVGDPEWIGVLQRPDAPYGPNNPFVARYAFIAVPIGNTLDLNAIHNQTRTVTYNPMNFVDDGYFRNQGVGSWEINLAAFLADLNTNEWGQDINLTGNFYQYNEPTSNNRGRAFEDAFNLLAWRYDYNYNLLDSLQDLSLNGSLAFPSDSIDGYSDGPLQTTSASISESLPINADVPTKPWAGADNTNQFFTHQDLFDPAKTQNGVTLPALGFTDRLIQAGTNFSTNDRYTFYRLLSQMGTDTTPEDGKMNLNYVNVDANGRVVPNLETNFIRWLPLQFFTNAADRLLRAYTAEWRAGNPTNFVTTFYATAAFTNFSADDWTNYPAFGIGNIPVVISNQFVYSPAVNRLLQLAANLYDATTNNTLLMGKNFPSVFRPTFWVTNVDGNLNVFINGYQQVVSVIGTSDNQLSLPFEISTLKEGMSTNNYPFGVNVYGVPWIIGAKKGFPNFNEFVLENVVGVTRRLQVTRNTNATPVSITGTNQMYLLSINAALGVDFWNSYAAQYNGSVIGMVHEGLSVALTNDDVNFNANSIAENVQPIVFSTNCPFYTNLWSGSGLPPWYPGNPGKPNSASFITPLNGTFVMLTNSVYRTPSANSTAGALPPGFSAPSLIPTNYLGSLGMTAVFETNTPGFPLPHWGLVTTNQLQVFMLDQDKAGVYHVIDYAQFEQVGLRDLNSEIFSDDVNSSTNAGIWNTNINPRTGIPFGIENQINISKGILVPPGPPPSEDGLWKTDPQNGITPPNQQASFQAFFMPVGSVASVPGWGGYAPGIGSNYLSSVQAPYSPTRYAIGYTVYQANDPLVHYLASDLRLNLTNQTVNDYAQVQTLTKLDLGAKNSRYQPWGAKPGNNYTRPNYIDQNLCNLAYKDSLVWSSDNWDFPTNILPGLGWVGRIHRGTPWQTVDLKATNILSWVYNHNPYADGTNTWVQWTGDKQLTYGQYYDAINSAPVQDRLLFDLFTTALDDNATRGTLSVNQNHLAAWSALFSGVVVLSNNLPDIVVGSSGYQQYQSPLPGYNSPSNTVMIIQPAGVYYVPNQLLTQQPALIQIVSGINQARANTNLFPRQVFEHVGDILAVPQLTDESPFLHWNSTSQQTNGISDEMYEWLPQQAMSLLRCADSPRYVIYCYGQALKPAADGVYNGGGAFFGMITNYQVVSEVATRAVVRFDSMMTNVITPWTTNVGAIEYTNWVGVPLVTNNNAVIESFNPLPPD